MSTWHRSFGGPISCLPGRPAFAPPQQSRRETRTVRGTQSGRCQACPVLSDLVATQRAIKQTAPVRSGPLQEQDQLGVSRAPSMCMSVYAGYLVYFDYVSLPYRYVIRYTCTRIVCSGAYESNLYYKTRGLAVRVRNASCCTHRDTDDTVTRPTRACCRLAWFSRQELKPDRPSF